MTSDLVAGAARYALDMSGYEGNVSYNRKIRNAVTQVVASGAARMWSAPNSSVQIPGSSMVPTEYREYVIVGGLGFGMEIMFGGSLEEGLKSGARAAVCDYAGDYIMSKAGYDSQLI